MNCLSIDDWIKKRWFIYTMKYYSAMKDEDILTLATTWIDLENIVLSKISQKKSSTI